MNFTVTTAAEKFVRRMIMFNGGGGFRLAVTAGGCSGLAAQFEVEATPRPGDSIYQHKDLRFFLPAESRLLLDGVTVDFAETPTQSGFVFHDPKQASCGCKSTDGPAVGATAHTHAHWETAMATTMTNDIDEARNWCGNEIDCAACAHRDLLAQGRCELKRACVEDRYARRIDRFFDQNPSLADRYLRHPHFETRAIAAKHASVFLLPPLLKDPDETVRWNAAQRLPRRYLLGLRQDPHREVRIRVAAHLATEQLHPMMDDADYYVRLTVARRIAPSLLPQMMNDSEVEVRRAVARRIDARWLIDMAADGDADVRLEVAQRLAPNQLSRLRDDADWRVRYHVANQIGLSELSKMRGDADPLVQDVVRMRLTAEMIGLGSGR